LRDIALKNAAAYAAEHHLRLLERLGFGIHGTVIAAEYRSKRDQSAIKAHNAAEFHTRERAIYERLGEAEVTEILGFHVPQLIRADDGLWVIEMTIVTRPFVLDFAGAYLDTRPRFSTEIWAEWTSQKEEQFGSNWRTVQAVLDAFEELGIYLVDISPSNIAFAAK
jgi:hypothetical protein